MSNARVTFETLDFDDAAVGQEQRFDFNCPKHDRRCGGLIIAGRTTIRRNGQNEDGGCAQWDWNGDRDRPTFKPSVDCKGCWHGFIENGRTVDCSKVDEPEIARVRTGPGSGGKETQD